MITKSVFNKFNSTMIGSGLIGGIVLFLFAVMWGNIDANAEDITNMNLDVAKFNFEETSNKLDDVIEKTESIEDKVDVLKLIVCSEKNYSYCN